jgi:hypothetical protein
MSFLNALIRMWWIDIRFLGWGWVALAVYVVHALGCGR